MLKISHVVMLFTLSEMGAGVSYLPSFLIPVTLSPLQADNGDSKCAALGLSHTETRRRVTVGFFTLPGLVDSRGMKEMRGFCENSEAKGVPLHTAH